MSETYHLRCWTRVHATPDEVWALRAGADAGQEMPAWIQVEGAATPGPGATAEGRISLPMGLGGVEWREQFEAWEPPARWAKRVDDNDVFARWEHEQLFEETSDGCRTVDVVTFQPKGPARAVARAVLEIFLARHRKLAERVPTDKRATAVAVMRTLEQDFD